MTEYRGQMNVYIVMEDICYEGAMIMRVYSTEEAADNEASRLTAELNTNSTYILYYVLTHEVIE